MTIDKAPANKLEFIRIIEDGRPSRDTDVHLQQRVVRAVQLGRRRRWRGEMTADEYSHRWRRRCRNCSTTA